MSRQGILDKVTFFHPNLYNPDFVKKNAALFEGGIVLAGIDAVEHQPAPPALQEYLDYAKAHNLKVTELTEQGWIAAPPVRRRAEGGRAELHLVEPRERLEPADVVQQRRPRPADRLDEGAQRPGDVLASRSEFECQNFVRIHNGGSSASTTTAARNRGCASTARSPTSGRRR